MTAAPLAPMNRRLPLAVFVALSLAATAASAADNRFPYQGHLEKDGIPLNGVYDFRFGLFNAATAGSELWAENRIGLQVTKGAFSTTLGTSVAIPDAVLANPNLFVGVSVKPAGQPTFVALAGRQQLPNAPKARGVWEPLHSSATGVGSTSVRNIPVSLSTHSNFKLQVVGRLTNIAANSNVWFGIRVNNAQNGVRQVQPHPFGANSRTLSMLDKRPDGLPAGDLSCEYLIASSAGTQTKFVDGSCTFDDGATLYVYENSGVITGNGEMNSIGVEMAGNTTLEFLDARITLMGIPN